MNPAVSTGLVVAAGASDGLWVRWLLPLLGSLLASSFFLLTCPEAEKTLLVEAAAAAGAPVVSEAERAYARNVGRWVLGSHPF